MALQQRRPYVIFDKVVEQFLADFNESNPLKSSWTGFEDDSALLADDVCEFPTKREAEKSLKKLNEAFKDEPGGVDFALLRVKPRVMYELVKWPKYMQRSYLL